MKDKRKNVMLIDSHAHLDDEAFNEDREELIAQIRDAGIEYVVNTEVYVLIPKDDFTNEKIILWSANGINHFGPRPITSMTINSTDDYSVTTRIGEEKYIAIYSTPEENETNNEEAT